jgi:hypothetical protein
MKHYPLYLFGLMLFLTVCKPEDEMILPPEAKQPTDLRSTHFIAQWCPSQGASSYLLEVSTSPAFDSFVSGYEGKEIPGLSEKVENLSPETTYYYRLQAKNNRQISGYSKVIQVTTDKPEVLSTPKALTAEQIAPMSFLARWEMVAGAEVYYLDVATDKEFENFVQGYENKEVQALEVLIEKLEADTDYYYRLKTKKGSVISAYSNVIHVRTLKKSCKLETLTVIRDGVQQDYSIYFNEQGKISSLKLLVTEMSEDPEMGKTETEYWFFYQYDEQGRLTAVENQKEQFQRIFEYNEQNQVIRETEKDLNTGNETTVHFSYEENKIVGQNNETDELVEYFLDEKGNVVKFTLKSGGLSVASYELAYDDQSAPEFQPYLLNDITIVEYRLNPPRCLPEDVMPIWMTPANNVASFDATFDQGRYKVDFEYEYNGGGAPLSRKGEGEFLLAGEVFEVNHCDAQYTYSNCSQ